MNAYFVRYHRMNIPLSEPPEFGYAPQLVTGEEQSFTLDQWGDLITIRPVRCLHCARRFDSERAMQQHARVKHPQQSLLAQQLISRARLKLEMSSLTGVNDLVSGVQKVAWKWG